VTSVAGDDHHPIVVIDRGREVGRAVAGSFERAFAAL
jgi:hypothetical protein